MICLRGGEKIIENDGLLNFLKVVLEPAKPINELYLLLLSSLYLAWHQMNIIITYTICSMDLS